MKQNNRFYRRQTGSVLLMSLVILLVMSITGLMAVKMATIEEKMSGNYQDQHIAMYAAESALREVEQRLQSNSIALNDFDANCTNGLCFDGNNMANIAQCRVGHTEPWRNESIWLDEATHQHTTVLSQNVSQSAKYIIEFRCYLPKVPNGPAADKANITEWAQFYRITVLAFGGSNSARVMLQSTYKKN